MKAMLNEHERLQLDALLDHLIPANATLGITAAGASGTGAFIEDEMAKDESLLSDVQSLLSCAESISEQLTTDTVRQLEEQMPVAFNVLLRLTYMGYYSRSENRASVGVAAWPVHPKGYVVKPESADMLDQMLAPVRARGPVYRDV